MQEIPALEEAVAAGRLPPLEMRIPANPAVVQPIGSVGRHGGTLRTVLQGHADVAWMDRLIGCESLVRWDPMWSSIVPNLAQSWTINEDATEYVFHLRSGVRWSDGTLFTADDIVFWNETIFRGGVHRLGNPPAWMHADGHPVVVEKRGDHAVVFKYAVPNSLLLQGLAGFQGDEPVCYPRHVLGRYDPRIDPEGSRALQSQAGDTNWMELLRRAIGHGSNELPRSRWRVESLPRLTAWQFKPGSGFGSTRVVEFVRNPYYWKVDTAGQPLPYLDGIRMTVAASVSESLDMAVRGEIDLGERALTVAENLPRLNEARAAGGYHFARIVTDSGNLAVIALNLTHRDAERRVLFRNRDFRVGLSHAIDRARIIREVLQQDGVPCQMAPRPESPLYNDRLATQHTEFSRELAGRHLDAAGLNRRDADGLRMGPGDRPLVIRVEVARNQPVRIEALKRVREDWAAVGVGMDLVIEEARVLLANRAANRLDAAAWAGDGGMDLVMDPRYYLPVSDESLYAVSWARWFNDPASRLAERPGERVLRQMELYRRVQATVNPDARQALMAEILELAVEEFPVIGLCTADNVMLMVKDDLRNVPDVMMSSGRSFPAPAPCNPCQFYFDPPRPESS